MLGIGDAETTLARMMRRKTETMSGVFVIFSILVYGGLRDLTEGEELSLTFSFFRRWLMKMQLALVLGGWLSGKWDRVERRERKCSTSPKLLERITASMPSSSPGGTAKHMQGPEEHLGGCLGP